MGKGTKVKIKDQAQNVRNIYECPECDFEGNFTQIRLHLKVVHKFTGALDRNSDEVSQSCRYCGAIFFTRKKIRKHILSMH